MRAVQYQEERFPSVDRLLDALMRGETVGTVLGDAVLAHPSWFAEDSVLAVLDTRRRLRGFNLTLLITTEVDAESVVLRRTEAPHRAPRRAG
ncbi:MAG TPA: hypothetical protein VJ812_12220 [Gemmatimonadaceae bacterium]|jgi:hypothetical protein|nr:hypothetical protein [Gemmatimonadaceae bacterium]